MKILESMGGWCRGQIVDISKREEVYKAAADIKSNYGDVSIVAASINLMMQRLAMNQDLLDHIRSTTQMKPDEGNLLKVTRAV